MSQTEKIRESIEGLAKVALGHRKLDEAIKARILAALKKLRGADPPKILLFGVSQAGKSTLLSALMRGDQFVPIGIGTATTVVPTELWPVETAADERAVIFLKTPQEVLASIKDALGPHLMVSLRDEDDGDAAAKGAEPSSASSSGGAEPSLADELRDKWKASRHKAVSASRRTRGLWPSWSYIDKPINDPVERREPAPASPTVERTRDEKLLRSLLTEALEEAEKHFRHSLEQGEPAENGEKLVMARALLSYYETYEQQYGEGKIELPLAEVHGWLRRPHDWMTRDEFAEQGQLPYSFDEVKCFYARRAQLFVRCVEGVSRVRLVDAPGYGITSVDDAVLNNEALQADSIVLVLGSQGSQITEAQLEQLRRLSRNLSTQSGRNLSRNPFILWNPKWLPKQQGELLLSNDLSTIRRELGLSISASRARVVNFLLALRARQLLRFDELTELSVESLSEEASGVGFPADESGAESKRDYVRRYLKESLSNSHKAFTHKTLEAASREAYEQALAASNLHSNLDSIIGIISQTHEALLLGECTKVVLDVLRGFLTTSPTRAKIEELRKQIDELTKAIPQFGREVKEEEQKKFPGLIKAGTDALKSELAATVWEYSHFRNLKASIKSDIDKTFSRVYVPAIKRRNLRELIVARLELWLQEVEKKESSRLRNNLLSEYRLAWLRLRDGLKPVCKMGEGVFTLPDWTDPRFDLSEFKAAFVDALDAALEAEFEDYTFKETTKSYEDIKVNVTRSFRGWLNAGRRLINKTGLVEVKVVKYPPEKRFDRAAFKAEVGEEVEGFYRSWKDQIPDEDMWKTAHEAFAKGIVRAFSDNSKAYDKLLSARLAELQAEENGKPAPLTEEERDSLISITEGLENALTMAEQVASQNNLSPL